MDPHYFWQKMYDTRDPSGKMATKLMKILILLSKIHFLATEEKILKPS